MSILNTTMRHFKVIAIALVVALLPAISACGGPVPRWIPSGRSCPTSARRCRT